MHAFAEIGHQIAERSGFPSLVERLETFGHAVGGRRDLIRVDGIELPAEPGSRQLRIPEDQRLAADQPGTRSRARAGVSGRQVIRSKTGFQSCGCYRMHLIEWYGMSCPSDGSPMDIRAKSAGKWRSESGIRPAEFSLD